MSTPTNLERAIWAENALYDLCADTGCSLDDALNDLLADLMHWASLAGRDFEHALTIARMHFNDEVRT